MLKTLVPNIMETSARTAGDRSSVFESTLSFEACG